ncbi:hypothetical protein [Sphingopyxis sp.]|uniref:hypothetical protein n=1 Tax=Sphingopyxis sp. TaxID=1908224 RepID=UPI003D0DE48A
MDTPDSRADAALKIIQQWQWGFCDPDGNLSLCSMGLDDAVNRLGMEGIPCPQMAVLSLLCRGQLVSRGYFRWQKYQWGEHYQLEGSNEILKPNRWQVLADLIAEERQQLDNHEWPNAHVDLEKLEMTDCPVYEWAFANNRFCTAVCPPETPTNASNYLEEWFSAWDIDFQPRLLANHVEDDAALPTPSYPATSQGGRPPIADWEAAALEIAGRYYRGDFKPNTIADVSRALGSWLGAQDIHPSESVLRTHGKAIFAALQSWEQE